MNNEWDPCQLVRQDHQRPLLLFPCQGSLWNNLNPLQTPESLWSTAHQKKQATQSVRTEEKLLGIRTFHWAMVAQETFWLSWQENHSWTCQFLTENQYPISTAAALHGRMQESLISYICELSAVTRQKCLLCNQCVITSTLQVGSDWLALPPEPTVGCEFTGQINILLVNMQTVPPYMGCH